MCRFHFSIVSCCTFPDLLLSGASGSVFHSALFYITHISYDDTFAPFITSHRGFDGKTSTNWWLKLVKKYAALWKIPPFWVISSWSISTEEFSVIFILFFTVLLTTCFYRWRHVMKSTRLNKALNIVRMATGSSYYNTQFIYFLPVQQRRCQCLEFHL